jgi:hypothetical protein
LVFFLKYWAAFFDAAIKSLSMISVFIEVKVE